MSLRIQLLYHARADHILSRYPELVREVIGQGLDDFKFLACSGDRSTQIYEQVPNMDSDTDMVIMTAGGNDLCLVKKSEPLHTILANCVFL